MKNLYKANKKNKKRKIRKFSWKKIYIVAAFIFITAIAVNFAQNEQVITQHAAVTYSEITPQFHCLTLGPSHCSGVASTAVTTCPGLTVVTHLKLNPNYGTLGDSIQGTIVYKNGCTIPYKIANIFIGASNNKNQSETDTFLPSGPGTTLFPGQTASVSGTLTIGSNDTPGTWNAYGSYTDGSGNPHPTKPGVQFTICGPLTVSNEITLDKKTVYPGQTITGQITYKNTCTAPYMVKGMKISVRDPNGSIDDFTPTIGNYTFPGGGSKTVTASRLMGLNRANDPLGTWKAFGAYQNDAGTWVIDNTLLSYILELQPVPPPSSSGTSTSPSTTNSPSNTGTPGSTSTSKPGSTTNSCTSLPSVLTGKLTIYFATDLGTNNGYTLTSANKQALDTYATALNKFKTLTVTINGYTDSSPFASGTTGTINNNQALSLARAKAAETYLKSKAASNKYVVKGDGVAPNASNDNSQDRRDDITNSCNKVGSGSSSGTGSGSGSGTGSGSGSGAQPACKDGQNVKTTPCTCSASNSFEVPGSNVCNICKTGTVPGAGYQCITPQSNTPPACIDGENTKTTPCTCSAPNSFEVPGSNVCNICKTGTVPGAGYQCVSTNGTSSGNTTSQTCEGLGYSCLSGPAVQSGITLGNTYTAEHAYDSSCTTINSADSCYKVQ